MITCLNCRTQVRADAHFCQHCGAPLKQIGAYRVVRTLRADGNVYVVECDKKMPGGAPKTQIAIEAARSLSTHLFEQARQMARLANVVPLWNQARDERGVPYVIVGYAPGEPLDQVSTPLAPKRALSVALQLATIVDYAHAHNLTFDVKSPRGASVDSLTRFQKAFLLDERDRLYFFDHTIWMALPRTGKAKYQDEDVLRILRVFLRLLTGTTMGKIVGALKQDSQQLASVTGHLVKNPPTSARNLVGAITQMLPPQPSPATTIKLVDRATQAMATVKLPVTPALASSAQTDVGQKRDHNEDNHLVLPLDATSALFAVADGMGGQAAGEVASQIAIDELRQRAQSEWTRVAQTPTPENIRGHLHGWIQRAHTRIVARARERNNNMGSTVTAALICQRQVFVANVGDSRTYLWRGGELYPLTWDHSVVASLVRAGLVEPDAAYSHPQRNEVFRSLGQKGELKVDVFEPIELGAGDHILLCSDGLWEMVRPPRLKNILSRGLDPAVGCAELIRAANAGGGEDNITVVLIQIE